MHMHSLPIPSRYTVQLLRVHLKSLSCLLGSILNVFVGTFCFFLCRLMFSRNVKLSKTPLFLAMNEPSVSSRVERTQQTIDEPGVNGPRRKLSTAGVQSNGLELPARQGLVCLFTNNVSYMFPHCLDHSIE